MEKIKRYQPNYEEGLTNEQVEERIYNDLVNYDTTIPTKSIKQIIRDNVATPFNFLNLFLALAVFLVGSYKNLMFMGVVICNSIISTFQEIRSKKIVDKLAILASKRVTVIRDSLKQHISINEIVLDDILVYQTGNQVVTDAIIIEGECEVSESFITGESDSILKKKGDTILSSSFIVSGKCYAQVEHVGLDNYAAKITHDAKYLKKVDSEIIRVINRIVKLISIIIIPLGCLLLFRQISAPGNTIEEAIVHTVAALIVMIPEGLVLLTSVVFAVSIMRLAKTNVLVQELYCIETLARTDVICLDKTGTITEGCMEIADMIPYQQHELSEIEMILGTYGATITDQNATIDAIRCCYSKTFPWKSDYFVSFSSKRKWSAVHFKQQGTYLLGAPEFIMKEMDQELRDKINFYSADNRVVGLFHSSYDCHDQTLPNELELIALLFIKDKIRKEAKQTLEYFRNQGVSVKIISGDHVNTVSNIASQLQIDGSDHYIDVSTLTEAELKKSVDNYTIFGRVSPEQKKQLIIALKEAGHTVAMIGDGINDVLALKEADCSVAMASGSDGARNVSQLVLLDSNFDSMPKVVLEGRRSTNNIERSSTLFLSKTIYATLLAILFLFVHLPYPFQPIQLTLISVATIGIPSFILALEPNKERITGRFFENVLVHSVPTAVTVLFHITICSILLTIGPLLESQISTLCVLLTAYVGFLLLYKLCHPFTIIRRILFYGLILFFFLQFVFMQEFYSLTHFTFGMLVLAISLIILDFAIFKLSNAWIQRQMQHSKFLKRILNVK